MLQLITGANNDVWNVRYIEYFYIEATGGEHHIKAKRRSATQPLVTVYSTNKQEVAEAVLRYISYAANDGKSAVDVRVLEGKVRDERPDLFE